jgi:UDP-glucose 4-epimerase
MRILVTGGAGFIGSHLAEELLRKGHSVMVLDDFSTGLRENVPAAARATRADVHDGEELSRILGHERPEVVLHLAAQMNIRRSIVDPVRDAEINVMGSLRLFQASARAGVRRVVFASSGGAVYGERGAGLCRETDFPKPTSPYGIAKLAAEHYGRHVAQSGGPEFVTLRLANVYGPRQNPDGEAGVIAIFLREMREGRAPVIIGSGEQTRDFVWVGDAVHAFLRALSGPPGTYNIGTGRETSVNEIFELLRGSVGFRGTPLRAAAVPGEVWRNALDSSLARDRLSWVPRMSLDQGLEETARLASRASLDRPARGTPRERVR